jgi:His/Glu/Gln/Arg/opine family amino acid ABC transporter permease subunit
MSLKKKTSKWQIIVVLSVVCVLLCGFVLAYLGVGTEGVSKVLTKTEAQTLVDNTLSKIPNKISQGAMVIFENIDIVVNEVEEGDEKNLIFKCQYSTLDVQNTLEPKLPDVFTSVYDMYLTNDALGKKTNATKVNIFVSQNISDLLSSADVIEGEINLYAYEVNEGEFSLYLDDYTVNTITGGIINTVKAIKATKSVEYNGETVNISSLTTLRTGISDSIGLNNYNSEKPYTGNAVQKFVSEFKYDFHRNFIQDNRWVYLLEGLGTTLAITGLAALLGIVLGFLIAINRCTHQTTGKLGFIDKICGFYLTITRGTPVMVQLLIIYFVILLPIGEIY